MLSLQCEKPVSIYFGLRGDYPYSLLSVQRFTVTPVFKEYHPHSLLREDRIPKRHSRCHRIMQRRPNSTACVKLI
jgi:hypothetical protein